MTNNEAYIRRFTENLDVWNAEHGRAYKFEDIQNKFLDIRMVAKALENTGEYATKCMCGHHIKNNYEIINPENSDIIILGSDCIDTYMIKSLLICNSCDERFKFKASANGICPKCKLVSRKCVKCGQREMVKKSANFVHCNACIRNIAEENERTERINAQLRASMEAENNARRCRDCGKFSKQYIRCYNCNLKFQQNKKDKNVVRFDFEEMLPTELT